MSKQIDQASYDTEEGKKDEAISSMKSSGTAFGAAQTPWYGTALILVSEVMGIGVLGLPYTVTTLGWAGIMIAMPLFAFFAGYSGYQLKVVKLAYPKIMLFSNAGTELVHPLFGIFTKYCMLINCGALAIYFLIATADSLKEIYHRGAFSCGLNRSVVAAILLVLLAQSRDFHTILKFLSLPLTVAIIITILIVVTS